MRFTSKIRLHSALLCGAAGAALLAGTASAQDPAGTSDVITVTAQKREQSVQEVPISVTVFGAAELERANVDEFSDYALRTPNVNFVNRGNRSETRISIRGISPISTAGTANLTGIFVDEFNIAPNISTRTADPQLFDTAQIEILKGPQGTFFGRNVVAGAISITSREPNLEEVEAQISLEAGEYDFYRVRASGSVPLSDTFAVRGLAYYDETGGWLENTGTGPSNSEENYGGRVAFRFEPNDRLSAGLSLYYSNNQQAINTAIPSGFPSESLGLLSLFTPPGTVPVNEAGFYPANTDTIATDIGFPSENETVTIISNVSYDFDNDINLTVVGGFIDNTFRAEGEGDNTTLPSFTIRRDEDLSAASLEARLTGSGDRYTWLVGAIYSEDDFDSYQNSIHLASDPLVGAYDTAFAFLGGALFGRVPGAPPPGAVPGFAFFIPGLNSSVGFFENVDFEFSTRSYAVFGEFSYDLTDRFNVSLGGRYSSDEIEGSRTEGPLQPGLAPRASLPTQDVSFDDFSPRLAATYDISEFNTVYAVASRGYRTGGFNTTPGDPNFEDEALWNYEAGIKGYTANGILRYAVSGFFMDWENTQVRAQDTVTQRQFILNAEGSEHLGAEIELGFSPIEGLDFDVAYGYVDAEFKSFTNARTLDGQPIDATGFPVPLSPEQTLSVVGQYERALNASLTGFVRAQYSYVAETREDVSQNARRLNPEYELWSFRAGIDSDSWSLQGYLENAFDEEYRFGTSNLETFLSGAQVIVGAPQRYGFVFTYRY